MVIQPPGFDIDELHASATRLSGLDDFGDDSYLTGLKVLAESYAQEAGLTPAGRKVKRAFLRSALMARLFAESSCRQHPVFEKVAIERPIFVTGLPRTGTTALHRLLCLDPAHQGLELWLTDVPQPRPPRETWEDNPIFTAIRDAYQQRSDLSGVHYTAADEVEECWYLLRQSMMSISFECLAHVPSYSEWLREQDWTPAYQRHCRNLQLIGLTAPDRRWVLKNPSHLFALDALLTAYPDAIIIQTHRDPVTAIASVCSLNARASHGWSSSYTGAAVGRAQLELWARGLHSFDAARARYPASSFIDVHYDEFVADPLGTVAGIYQQLGLELNGPARAAMAAGLQTPAEGTPSHRYDLADFGLTASQVTAALTHVG